MKHKRTSHHPRRRVVPLNNITIPLKVERELQIRRCQQIQDDCNRILETDSLFHDAYRQLRGAYTSGAIKVAQFRNVVRWQVAACLRRAGLPRNVSKAYQHMSVFSV